jgi:hypothetical protein
MFHALNENFMDNGQRGRKAKQKVIIEWELNWKKEIDKRTEIRREKLWNLILKFLLCKDQS